MIEFPIDPTPFVIPYAIVVFLCPWIVYGSFILRELALISKSGIYKQHLGLKRYAVIREFRKNNPQANYLHRKAIRWGITTGIMWITGFIILGTTLYLMEENDLLINHSKGLYAPSENK